MVNVDSLVVETTDIVHKLTHIVSNQREIVILHFKVLVKKKQVINLNVIHDLVRIQPVPDYHVVSFKWVLQLRLNNVILWHLIVKWIHLQKKAIVSDLKMANIVIRILVTGNVMVIQFKPI
eukprot:NODE_131_length_16689_cov_0.437914.p15 type:complete len:121 gc:universal NODE_131_length_16689_cov_0.437914:2184-1822(-)